MQTRNQLAIIKIIIYLKRIIISMNGQTQIIGMNKKKEKKSEDDEIYSNQKENKNDKDINNNIKNQKAENKNTTTNYNEYCPTIRLKSSEDKIYNVPFLF